MTKVSLERIAETLYPKQEPRNATAYGRVDSINADNSYQVQLNASGTTTRCARLCDADVGDRVLVLIQANGHCAAIGRVGGIGSPTVLYNDASGTTGTVTLSDSAANYDHMRIFFKKSSGENGCGSADVFSPNGKKAALTISEPASGSSAMWFASKTVTISGTTITTQDSVGGQVSSSPSCSGGNEIAIYRVEAWNVLPALGGLRGGGGGGGGHLYALSGSGLTLSLTEDSGATGNAGTYAIPAATASSAGAMSAAHFSKLDAIDEMSAAEATTGTSTTARTISAKVLNDLIDAKMPAAVQNGTDLAVE